MTKKSHIYLKKVCVGFFMLDYLWAGMILVGIVYAMFTGKIAEITTAVLDSSQEAVSLCVAMLGIMSLWVGLMEIAARAGIIESLSRKMQPVIRFLFPDLPKNHPVL